MKLKKWMVIAIVLLILAFHHHTYNNYHQKQTRKRRMQSAHVQDAKTDFYLLPGFIPVSF